MNDIVIRASNLTKVYRLYARPSYRFRDMFGLLGDKPGAFTEHAALDGINLEVRRGEKMAIIGRNGAGKSTFLKLVTKVIEPTSGVLDVKGRMQALLQIGTGFHPEFTGRENVYAYFAQLGVSGKEADRKCAEVIDFAELEEYIDQPMKTYSTGMGVRLMFSASTAITPDLLVLDEVLGVGDAYFAQKSYDRMRELCDRDGTTLLLVTHDVYAAIRLCGRVVWIDRGRILMDGDGPAVIKAYEDSIRQQEEQRLRLKNLQRLKELAEVGSAPGRPRYAVLEIASRNSRPQPGPVYISDVRLLASGELVASLPLGPDGPGEQSGSHLEKEGTAWGEPLERDGRLCRPMLNYGSAFHKAAGVFAIPRTLGDPAAADLTCAVEYAAPDGCDLILRLFIDDRQLELGTIAGARAEWTTWVGAARPQPAGPRSVGVVNTAGIHGTGVFVVRGARFVSDGGGEANILKHGDPATLEIEYVIPDPTLRERAQIVIALHKDGVQDVCRYIARDLLFDSAAQPHGTIRLRIPRLALTDGTYSVTIMIAREGYYDADQTVFYTINPGVYCCLSRLFDVSVIGSGLLGSGTVSVSEGQWALQ